MGNRLKKNVPVLRFPEFEGSWEKSSLLSLLEKVIDYRGKPPPKSDDGIVLITARNVKQGFLDFTSREFIASEDYASWMNRGIPQKGDVLFTTEAPLANVCMFPEHGVYALGQRTLTLRAKSSLSNGEFLFYILQSPKVREEIFSQSTGSTAKGIKSSIFKKIPLEVPSVAEQEKIASFLGAVDTRLSQLRRKHELLQTYKRGVMQKIFSQQIRFKCDQGKPFPDWEKTTLGEVAKIYDGTHQTPNYVKEGIPFYSVEHLTSNNFTDTKFISEEVFYQENKRVCLEKGDILMTRIGDIGTCRLIDWDVRASFYVSLALIKSNKIAISGFLTYAMSSIHFQRELHKRTIHVAFPKKINLGEIGNCRIAIPCINEQEKIAGFLIALDQKIKAIAKQIELTEQFKKGLLQKMFV
jgi:type I restriction enzyme S subunit